MPIRRITVTERVSGEWETQEELAQLQYIVAHLSGKEPVRLESKSVQELARLLGPEPQFDAEGGFHYGR